MRTNLKSGRLAAAIAGAVVAAAFTIAPAHADVVGTMTCNIAPGEGAIVVSQRAVSCTFVSNGGPAQLYKGFISRLGVDIGNQTSGVLTYAVVAIGVPGPGALAGEYVGPGFGVSLGNGGGVNALVGGGNSFALQPISGTTSTGVNINAGVGELHLTFSVEPTRPTPRMQFFTDSVIHDIVPLLTLIFWIAFAPREGTRWYDALWIIAYPAAYLAMTLVAGALGQGYPYNFLDVDKLGFGSVLVVAAIFLAIFYALGLVTTGLSMGWDKTRQ